MTKQTLIVGTANLSKAVASILNRGKKLDADIQLAGVSILAHIAEHGNVTLMNDLVAALPKGSRKNALLEWACKFGKLRLNEGADRKVTPLLFNKEGTTDIDGAWDKPWYEFQPEKELVALFDVQAELAKLLKRAASIQKTNPNCEVKGGDLLAKLAALAEAQ